MAVVAGVVWLESSVYRWAFDQWPGRLWGMLQVPIGFVLGSAVFLWYAAMKWRRSADPPEPR